MRWRNLERSKNVEDRRGQGAKIAGGVGGLGIIGLLLALFLGGGGGDLGGMGDLLGQLGGGQQTTTPPGTTDEFAGVDEDEDFVMAILGTTETLWMDIFAASGQTYDPARVVLFSQATQSACGGANSATGPHYCPLDETVYIDLTFYDELQRRFGAQGDFAEAYVLAHEIGHHVQHELGIMDDVRRLQRDRPDDANEYSVRLELQADCLAGVWAHSIFQRGNVLEPGDIHEGLNAAAAVGDDRIQLTTTGRVNPEDFTHGTSEQRVNWFNEGYRTGDPAACDTFNNEI